MSGTSGRQGARLLQVGGSVIIRLEEGIETDEDLMPTLTLTPARALRMSGVLVKLAWKAAAHARRRPSVSGGAGNPEP